MLLTRGPLLPTIMVPPLMEPPSHEMPVVHCCTLEGFVRGSHLALSLPSGDLHSTPRIWIPWPQDTEHFCLKGKRKQENIKKYLKNNNK